MVALTKKEEKLILSLQQKKFRKQEGLFVVEGFKMVEEAIKSDFNLRFIVTSLEFDFGRVEVKQCTEAVMRKISSLKTPPGVLAVLELPEEQNIKLNEITLVTDRVQDPGNLGTIIRTAEALGVNSVVLSEDTVDVFSPKVVQATMGSVFRMKFLRTELSKFFKENSSVPVYAAHLNGKSLYEEKVKVPCYLLVGNESQGVSDQLLPFVHHSIKIPMQGEAESFNVSIATAIILSEFRRQIGQKR